MSSLRSCASSNGISTMDEWSEIPEHLFSLKRNAIHALAILSNLNEQRKNASHYCDVQISSSDHREFWAHKLILDVFTDYFEEPGRFALSDVDSESLQVFLDFVYAGSQPRLTPDNALRYMRASIRLGFHQITRITLEYCIENLFEVLSSEYFASLAFEEFSVLPVFEESVALDKLEESKYRRVIRRWVSADADARKGLAPRLEKLFAQLWTVDDHERALAISVDVLGISNLVQFNFQDGKWYQCEYSCKASNLSVNSLQNVQQMGLYKTDYFVFRDNANNVYCSSSELKRIWNKSSTLGTLVATHCIALKQLRGQVYAFFDCLKRWNGELKKFEVVLCKDVVLRHTFSVVDFTMDDYNDNVYLLGSFDSSPNRLGILTVRNGESPFFVPLPGDHHMVATSVLTGADNHLIIYGTSGVKASDGYGDGGDSNGHGDGDGDCDVAAADSEVFIYDLHEKRFRPDLYECNKLDADACLFRLNHKLYSMVSTDGEPEHKLYRVARYPMAIDEAVTPYKYNIGENQTFIKAVCICPAKPYHTIVYGSES